MSTPFVEFLRLVKDARDNTRTDLEIPRRLNVRLAESLGHQIGGGTFDPVVPFIGSIGGVTVSLEPERSAQDTRVSFVITADDAVKLSLDELAEKYLKPALGRVEAVDVVPVRLER